MIFEVVTFELPKKSWASPVTAIYKKKIDPFVPLEIRFLKASSQPRKNAAESKRIASKMVEDALDPKSLKVCIDERGRSLDSLEFAKVIDRSLESGKQKVQWILGGPYGVEESIRNQSDICLSLSKMVMNQEVALTVTLEQIYRSFTIRNNLPYHNL